MHKRRLILRKRKIGGGKTLADNGNVYQAWKGAVEPAFIGPTGNEYQAWKGAVEPGA